MAAITESLRALAEKMGAENKADTITGILNSINDTVDAENGRNITEALRNYKDAYTPTNSEET